MSKICADCFLYKKRPATIKGNGRRDVVGERGFMVISFVIVLSIVMLGMLRSLAAFASEQVALEAEIAGRQHADEVALDCVYMLARVLAVQATIGEFEGKTVPIMDGTCSVSDVGEIPVLSNDGSRISGTESAFDVHAKFGGDGSGVGVGNGVGVGVGSRVYHSRMRAIMRERNGQVDFIKI